MIYWDLDGVLRNLHEAVYGKTPDTWDCDIVKRVNHNLKPLLTAKPSEFYPLVKDTEITILTHQQPMWRSYTERWIAKWLPKAKVIYVNAPEEKLTYLKDGDYLVEDNPKLTDYSKIILIMKPYNKHIFSAVYNARTCEDLQGILDEIAYEGKPMAARGMAGWDIPANGVRQSSFVKHDSDKVDFSMLDYDFLEGVSRVLMHGEKKYDRQNWKRAEKADGLFRYTKALLRHVLAFAVKGEWLDAESGLPHIYHAACCLQFISHFHGRDK
jgi:hypothetical protein